ncbi:hypothetical protein Q5P01_009315 [Channa striata]|uniref:Uncharacterized protein n=1 Tax=Channa striata TaxID=64152 RepID=A0AA88SSG4_CHASR|nr:hypothetical protein Q5P01_009315 [Channa striata]
MNVTMSVRPTPAQYKGGRAELRLHTTAAEELHLRAGWGDAAGWQPLTFDTDTLHLDLQRARRTPAGQKNAA